jgi:hypothetical protein
VKLKFRNTPKGKVDSEWVDLCVKSDYHKTS